MNYFAHALPLLDQAPGDAYVLAGVATPDWLGVVAKKTKCRTRHAAPYLESEDPRVASLARGVSRHHADDRWFHETAAFNQLSLDFARRLRDAFSDTSGMRPWFLGHVLVELLLDATLIAQAPARLDEYYQRIEAVDAAFVQQAITMMSGRPVGDLAWFIDRYREVRFLADYQDDQRLTFRLNQVMKRVRLPQLPADFAQLLPAMRASVDRGHQRLLTPP